MHGATPRVHGLLAIVMVATLLGGSLPLALAGPVAAALPAPTLVAPGSGSVVNGNPVFQWTAVSNATKYKIEVSQSASFTPTVVSDETTNLRYAPTTELPLGTLYWRVAAKDTGGVLGTWAEDAFDKEWGSAPNPVSPANSAVLSFPTDPLLFTWEPLSGAESYQLQVDDAVDFIGASTYSTKNTSYVLTDPRTNGQSFFWRVRGVSGGLFSDYSVPRSFTFEWPSVPILVAPPDGDTLTDVEFDWDPVPGAKTYEIQVSPNGDWANNLTFKQVVKGTRYANKTSLNNGNYFWRVRAIDAAANNGAWSAEWQFHRGWPDRPVLIGPTNGDLNLGELTFSWQPVEHAAYYELEWSDDPNFLPVASHRCFTNHTTVTPYGIVLGTGTPGSCDLALPPGQTIYWHVRGIDPPVLNPGAGEPGVLGLWSNTSLADLWSLVYLPYTPSQSSPADGATVEVPTLSWDGVPGASRYRVTIVDKNGTTTNFDTYSTSFTPTAALSPANSPFRWYVRVYDFANNLGVIPAQSDWSSFTLVAIATTFATPDPTGPADGTGFNEMPSLTWQPVTGATSYKVWQSSNGLVFSQLGSSTAYPAYTYPTSVLAAGTYTWYVEAFNGSTLISDSFAARRTFLIVPPDLLATGAYTAPDKCLPASLCAPIADTPTLQWDVVPGALLYRVYVANDPNFTNMYRTYDTVFTRLTPRESYVDNQAGQAFYWFVRPIRSNNSGRFDSQAQQNASAFQKRSQGIALASPANLAVVPDEINFRWDDFLATNQGLAAPVNQEAKQYRITVSTAADFATTLDQQTVDQPFYTPYDMTYPEGPIYWRVQAIDQSGNLLTLSTSRQVSKTSAPVTLSYPSNAAVVAGVPYLRWQPEDYAASYYVQLDDNDTFSSPISGTTSMSAWAYTEPLAAGTYYWRVRRNDADNRSGPWSATRSFSLAPAAPTLVSPTDGAHPSAYTLLLTWTAAQPSPRYSVDVSTAASFATHVSGFPVTTGMSAFAPKALLANGTYYWRVKALNASSAVIATSNTFSFTVDSSRPTVTAVSPSSGLSVTGTITVTFSEPVTGVDGTTFTVSVGGVAQPGTVTVLSPTQARWTPANLLVAGQTYVVGLSSVITDTGGNPLVPYSANVRTSTTVQESSPVVTEAWARWTTASASGGSLSMARRASSRLAFTFTGTSISLVGYKGREGGYASISVDGVVANANVSFYAASGRFKSGVWSKSGLAAGRHTVVVTAKGTKPSASRGTWVYVDAFTVDGTTTTEDRGAGVVATFRRVTTTRASGSKYDVMDHRTATGRSAPTLSFTFKGTGITWYGTKGTGYGKAAVYIDNVKKATIDLYRSATAYQQKLWTSTTLSNSVHTLRIVVLGSKRSASKGYDVSFDRFTIR